MKREEIVKLVLVLVVGLFLVFSVPNFGEDDSVFLGPETFFFPS